MFVRTLTLAIEKINILLAATLAAKRKAYTAIVMHRYPCRQIVYSIGIFVADIIGTYYNKSIQYILNLKHKSNECTGINSTYSPFSYPEPCLRAVNGARRGALAKSISNWHLIGYNEGYCSNTGYILWPEPLVAPRVRRALGTRMHVAIIYSKILTMYMITVNA